MKFKSDLAQEAYEKIIKKHDDLESRLNGDTEKLYGKLSPYEHVKLAESNAEKTIRVLACAIEVAAKIEIEERRLEHEKMKGWIPQETSSGCEHEWYQDGADDINNGIFRCQHCSEIKREWIEETR